jgi:hypothetical protein
MIRNKTMASIALLVAALPAQAMFGFASPQVWPEQEGIYRDGRAVLVQDVNADGLQDVVLVFVEWSDAAGPQPKLGVFRQNAMHGLDEPEFHLVMTKPPAEDGDYSIDQADVDGDGEMEIVIGSPEGFSVIKPSADFAILSQTRHPDEAASNIVRTADFDGDGVLDLAWLNADRDDPLVRIYRGSGHGVFQPKIITNVPRTCCFKDMRIADLNGDGSPDLVFSRRESSSLGYAEGLYAYYIDGQGPIQIDSPSLSLPFNAWGGIAIGDIDNDGTPDLIGGTTTTQDPTLGGMRAYLHSKLRTSYRTSRNWQVPQAAVGSPYVRDVDGDGLQDLLFPESKDTGGELPSCFIDYVPSGGSHVYRYPSACLYGHDQLAVGDINGDGLNDLVMADGEFGLSWAYGTNSPQTANLVVGEGLTPGVVAFHVENASTTSAVSAPTVTISLKTNKGRIGLTGWSAQCTPYIGRENTLTCTYPDLAAGAGVDGVVHYSVVQSMPYMQLHAEAKATTTTEETTTTDNTATAAMWIRQL